MPIDLTTVNLDSPAFAPEERKEEVPAEAPQAEREEKEEPATSGAEPVVDEEEQRVPYSRLQEAVARRREAERRAEEMEMRYQESLRESRERSNRDFSLGDVYKGEMDPKWIALYGDDEKSRRAYGYELQRQAELRDQIRREAIEAVYEERQAESQSVLENERTIDERLDDFQASLGRPLTPSEEEAILDIVDEYTPTGRDGKYAGDLISFEKAWDIYEMRQSRTQSRASKGRRTPTALTAASTEGEPSSRREADKNFDPLDWNSWKKRIPD